MIFWILFFLTSNCSATSPDAPFFVREMKDQHDVAAMNENFRSMSDYVRQLGNSVSTDAGVYVTASGNNTFTGENYFTKPSSFTGSSYFTGAVNLPVSVSSVNLYNQTMTFSASNELNVCLSGSTVSYVSNAGDLVSIELEASIKSSGAGNQPFAFSYLIDGGYTPGNTKTDASSYMYSSGSGADYQVYFKEYIYPSAGSHSYCLTVGGLVGNQITFGVPGIGWGGKGRGSFIVKRER